MQQFTPYFPGFENPNQPQQAQPQQAQQQQAQQQQAQQQQPLSMNGPNLAIYTPAAMQPLSVLAAAQKREQQQHQAQHQHQQQQQQHQQQAAIHDAMSDIGAHGKPKRKQVKNACVNCQKACKKCDIGRPCQRCIKYGLTETCINSVRKERKKGVKRGPYKKRNKSGGDSGTSSGASTPNTMQSPMANANLYAAAASGSNNNSRGSASATTSMPMHYQPFPTQGNYDPYAYANGNQMMPQAYMVPTTIQQMYPTNPPVLSYMNMIAPQQQQQQNGAYMQQSNPANSATTTLATNTTAIVKLEETEAEDDDDEGNKLTILSQLCSAVLDRNDTPKDQQQSEETKVDETTHQNTPPPSRPHSRETSHDQNEGVVNGPNFGNDSPHTYVNGHLIHRGAATATTTTTTTTSTTTNTTYGTPGSSPVIDHFNNNNNNNSNSKVADINGQQWSNQQQDHA